MQVPSGNLMKRWKTTIIYGIAKLGELVSYNGYPIVIIISILLIISIQ